MTDKLLLDLFSVNMEILSGMVPQLPLLVLNNVSGPALPNAHTQSHVLGLVQNSVTETLAKSGAQSFLNVGTTASVFVENHA